ncbi:MAG: TonB-dependent receptor plug [Gemmatimonadetes bacterium]|nr:TonB-dependent receptor plug [Gemmatimonadota bacterium]
MLSEFCTTRVHDFCARRAAPRMFVALLAVASIVPVSAVRAQQPFVARQSAYIVRFASSIDESDAPVLLRQPVTMALRNVTVERVLQEIARRAGVSFSYSRAVVPLDRIVSVNVRDASVLQVLYEVLGSTNVELWVSTEGRMALVPAAPPVAPAAPAETTSVEANGTVTGRVTMAASSEPVSDAAVTVSGATARAVTNADGRYTLNGVPEGTRTVFVQRIGLGRDSATVLVRPNQTVTANFSLRSVAVRLNEVVSIGYGTQSRRDLTGSVASVVSDDIQRMPVVSLEQALQGHAAGVQVTGGSGQPGASAAVRIRGGNSITAGNDPLYVIDGVPVSSSANGTNTSTLETQGVSGLNPLAALNPADIESIEVLKDASATSIYGARASNGVILVTTKRGRSGANNTNFGAYYGTQTVRHRLDLLNAQQFAQNANAARLNAGQPALYTTDQVAALPNTDWQSAIFRSAPTSNYEGSFSGGTTDTHYYLSGNFLRQAGVIVNTNLDRGTARLNFDQDISSRFRVGNRFTFSRSQAQLMPNGGAGQEVSSVLINALTAPPTLAARGSGGEYFVGLNPANGRTFANPVAAAQLITNQEEQNRFVGNVFGEYSLLQNLTFRTSLGGDYLSSMQDFYSPSTTYPGVSTGGQGSRGSVSVTTWLNENTLHYALGDLGLLHSLDLLGGLTLQRTNSDNISGTSQNFVTDALGQNGLNSGGTFLGVWSGAPHSSLLSYFARANWNLADRFLFTVTGRRDGSSKFGEGNQYGFFPSGAIAWRLSDESFVKRLGLFDDLKLRTSYGRTGNQDIGNYRALATLGSSTYLFNGSKVVGYAPSTLANPLLKWETTDQADAGLDIAMLRSRLLITADAYNKTTKDLLLEVSVPATLGYSTQLQNIGSVRNHGIELAVNTANLTGALGWTTSFNIAWNRNRVLNIGADTQLVNPVGVGAGANQNPTILKVGQPINSFYGYVYSGMKNGQPTYADLNGDGRISTADQQIIGSAQPTYTGGLTNQFNVRNFDLTVFIQFSRGNQIYNITRALLTNNAGNSNQLTDVLAAASSGANGIPVPKLGNSYDTRPSTLFVEDGSYIRGKSIRLGYHIPESLMAAGRIRGLHDAQIYASMQNFFTTTKYTGFDPEVSEYATSVLAQGIDFGTYPQTRQITFGFTTAF